MGYVWKYLESVLARICFDALEIMYSKLCTCLGLCEIDSLGRKGNHSICVELLRVFVPVLFVVRST